jgi:hypothetical protein
MKKNIKKVSIISGLIILAFLFLMIIFGKGLLLIYLIHRGYSFEEISRHRSHNGKVDAILMRSNCGAMSSQTYWLYVVPTGTEITKNVQQKWKNNVVFNAQSIQDCNIFWKHDKLLEIKYVKAKIFQFRNNIRALDTSDFSYVVEIRETPMDPCSSLFKWER